MDRVQTRIDNFLVNIKKPKAITTKILAIFKKKIPFNPAIFRGFYYNLKSGD